EGKIVSWNSGAERILGYSEAEVTGREVSIIFTPEDKERGRLRDEMQEALRTGRAQDQRWHVRKGGGRFWADGILMPLRDGADEPRGFIKILRDRTAEMQAESRISEGEERFRLLVESATEFAIFTTDRNGRVTTWNAGAERLLGYPEAEILGRDSRVIFT